MIDEEIRRIVNEQYAACKEVLTQHKEKIELLAEDLLAKETLTLPDIVDILGPRPYPAKESIIEYLQELRARKDVAVEEDGEEEEAKKKAAAEATKFDPDADDGEKEEVEAAEQAQETPVEEGEKESKTEAKEDETVDKDSDASKKDSDKKD